MADEPHDAQLAALSTLDPLFPTAIDHDDADDLNVSQTLEAFADALGGGADETPADHAESVPTGSVGGTPEPGPAAGPSSTSKGENAQLAELQAGLEAVSAALQEENARLRAMIAAMERGAGGIDPALDGGALSDADQHVHAGLVYRLVLSPPSPELVGALDLAHQGVTDELAATRAAIEQCDRDIAAARKRPAAKGPRETEAQLQEQADAAARAVDASRKQTGVLRDIARRLGDGVDDMRAEVATTKAELTMVGAAEPGHVRAEREREIKRVMINVRSHIETMLRQWRDVGSGLARRLQKREVAESQTRTLPALPLPHVAIREPLPSSLPRPSLIPAALAHLVPDTDAVRAREADTPLRRRGVKRPRDVLEREKAREEEEGEMLRNIVGMSAIGTWAKDEDD